MKKNHKKPTTKPGSKIPAKEYLEHQVISSADPKRVKRAEKLLAQENQRWLNRRLGIEEKIGTADQEIINALKKGMSYAGIRKQLGFYPARIARVKKKYGHLIATPPKPGETQEASDAFDRRHQDAFVQLEKNRDEEAQFYLTQLVAWLVDDGGAQGHNLEFSDATVKSQKGECPFVFDLSDRFPKGPPKTPFTYRSAGAEPLALSEGVYVISATKAITANLFRKGRFDLPDFKRHSHPHYYTLHVILASVFTRTIRFMETLDQALLARPAINKTITGSFTRQEAILNFVLDKLKVQFQNGYQGILIPDLYSYVPTSAERTSEFKCAWIIANPKTRHPNHLYTFMYSKQTSDAFSLVLKDILEQKMADLVAMRTQPKL